MENKSPKFYFKFLAIGIVIGIILLFFINFYKSHKINLGIKTKLIAATPHHVRERSFILKAIDGDTLLLKDKRYVRLIGVDTPELHHTEIPVQFFAEEAYNFTKGLSEGKDCELEYEGQRLDSYGRTLAYVWLPEGICLNEEIIKRGYGYVYTRFPFSKMNSFIELERRSRQDQRGMWTHSPTDARVAGIIKRYELLNEEGKKQFDLLLDKLTMGDSPLKGAE